MNYILRRLRDTVNNVALCGKSGMLEKVLLKAVIPCAFAHALLGLLGLVPLMLSFLSFPADFERARAGPRPASGPKLA